LAFNDKNICQDVEQLAGSAGETFSSLFDDANSKPEGSPRLIPPKVRKLRVTNMELFAGDFPRTHKRYVVYLAPATTSSDSGLKQRTEIFILTQVAGVLEQIYGTAANLECDCANDVCAVAKNIMAPILSVVWFIILKVSRRL
jgi:hypothetical protein